ncbi:MAG: hypothetical protein ABI790_02385 [Betaproteobacteria bacterium]
MSCAHTGCVSVVFYHRQAAARVDARTPASGDFARVTCRCGEGWVGVPLWISTGGVPAWVTRAIASAKPRFSRN